MKPFNSLQADVEIFILEFKEVDLVMTHSMIELLCFLMLWLVSGSKEEIYECTLVLFLIWPPLKR